MACSFCGENKTIHPESGNQYGEPVCESCFNESYIPDPDSSSDWKDTSGRDMRVGDRSRHVAEFHAARTRNRNYPGS
jgi:hypothetical protein